MREVPKIQTIDQTDPDSYVKNKITHFVSLSTKTIHFNSATKLNYITKINKDLYEKVNI